MYKKIVSMVLMCGMGVFGCSASDDDVDGGSKDAITSPDAGKQDGPGGGDLVEPDGSVTDGGADSQGVDGSGVDAMLADGPTTDGVAQCVGNAPLKLIAMRGEHPVPLQTLMSDGSSKTSITLTSGESPAAWMVAAGGAWLALESDGQVRKQAADGTGDDVLISSYKLTIPPGGGPPYDLEDGTLSDVGPILSSDGSTFHWMLGEDDYSAVMRRAGTAAVEATVMHWFPRGLATSPGGETIALTYWKCLTVPGNNFRCHPRSEGKIGLFTGTAVTELATHPGSFATSTPAVDPSGKKIAYIVHQQAVESRIYVVDKDNPTPLALTPNSVANERYSQPHLSATRLVYVHQKPGAGYAVESVKLDGTGDLQTHFSSHTELVISLSSDGTALAIIERNDTISAKAALYTSAFPACKPKLVLQADTGWGFVDMQ